MTTTHQPAPQENQLTNRQAFLDAERDKWLSVEEAAYVLGTSHTTIRRMLKNQSLPHRRDGKVIRIHLDALKPQAKEGHHADTCSIQPIPAVARAASSEAVLEAARRRFRAAFRR